MEAPCTLVLYGKQEIFCHDVVREGRLNELIADVVDVETLLVDDEAVRLLDADLLYHELITDNPVIGLDLT